MSRALGVQPFGFCPVLPRSGQGSLGQKVFATSRCARRDGAGTLRVPVACDRDQRVRRRTEHSASTPFLASQKIERSFRALTLTVCLGVRLALQEVRQERPWVTKKR